MNLVSCVCLVVLLGLLGLVGLVGLVSLVDLAGRLIGSCGSDPHVGFCRICESCRFYGSCWLRVEIMELFCDFYSIPPYLT